MLLLLYVDGKVLYFKSEHVVFIYSNRINTTQNTINTLESGVTTTHNTDWYFRERKEKKIQLINWNIYFWETLQTLWYLCGQAAVPRGYWADPSAARLGHDGAQLGPRAGQRRPGPRRPVQVQARNCIGRINTNKSNLWSCPNSYCDRRHDCSECRSVERFKVGQNLYQSFNTREVGPNWRKAIDSWFTEIDQFPVSSVSGYRFNHKTGHYSQMVWGATTRIGCGAILYRCKLCLIISY